MKTGNRWEQFYSSGILRKFAGVAATSVFSRILQLVLTVFLARELTPEGYGIYVFATGAGLLGGRLGSLGWPVLASRFIPSYSETGHWSLLRGLFRQSEWVIGVSSVCTAVILFGLVDVLDFLPHLSRELYLASILIPVMAFQSLRRNQLIGLNSPTQAVVVNEVIPPFLVLTIAISFALATVEHVILAYLVANIAAIFYGTILVRKRKPSDIESVTPQTQLFSWMKIALPALVGMSGLLLMNKADVLMLAPLSSLDQVGFYGSSQRLTYLQAAPVILLSTLLSPRFARAFAAKNRARMRTLLLYALSFAAVVSIPIGLGLALYSEVVVSLAYGHPYAEAAPVLTVLALGQIASALTIPTTSFLLMTGGQNRFGLGMAVALGINVSSNLWLIPLYGAVGAAITTAFVMVFLFILQVVGCFRTLRNNDI